MTPVEENAVLMATLQKVTDAISRDMNGVHGMPLSGNGGLISDKTMRTCDDARITMHKLIQERK